YEVGTSPHNSFDTGSIGAADTGEVDIIQGKGLVCHFDNESDQWLSLEQPVHLEYNTPYVLAIRARKLASTGNIFTLSIVDSIGGNIVTDHQGSNIAADVEVQAGTGSAPDVLGFIFSIPPTV